MKARVTASAVEVVLKHLDSDDMLDVLDDHDRKWTQKKRDLVLLVLEAIAVQVPLKPPGDVGIDLGALHFYHNKESAGVY